MEPTEKYSKCWTRFKSQQVWYIHVSTERWTWLNFTKFNYISSNAAVFYPHQNPKTTVSGGDVWMNCTRCRVQCTPTVKGQHPCLCVHWPYLLDGLGSILLLKHVILGHIFDCSDHYCTWTVQKQLLNKNHCWLFIHLCVKIHLNC